MNYTGLRPLRAAVTATTLACLPQIGHGGAFIFAGESNGTDIITHPTGYLGAGGVLQVNVCIDPASPNATDMVVPLQNIIRTFNQRTPRLPNLITGTSNNIPSSAYDFESVALHEVGHCIGLAHVNAASESGLSGNDQNYTKATDGANNVFDINSSGDGVIGSGDDVRGDDVNLHWFNISNNDPFDIAPAGTVDTSTYSMAVSDLPVGHNFPANASRDVSTLLGYGSSEAVMQQGTYNDEAQRTLVGDGVATLELAMAGLDETAGTADDYSLELVYGGISSSGCDVTLAFDNTQTGFAVCQTGGQFVNGSHVRITSANVYFNTGYNWFFNDVSVSADKIGVYRPGGSRFYLDLDENRAWGGMPPDFTSVLGVAGDQPIIGDWDGDGVDDIGVRRNNLFFLDLNGNRVWDAGTDGVFAFGTSTDLPVIGDWDGDGIDDFGVRRNHLFFVDLNGNRVWDAGADGVFAFGTSTDVPIIGDWDGDGIDDIGVRRNHLFFLDLNGNRAWDVGDDGVFPFGTSTDLPVIGDWNADGIDDFGIRRSHLFFLDLNGNNFWDVGVDGVFPFGVSSDMPLAGKW
jgi:hypothetical protein